MSIKAMKQWLEALEHMCNHTRAKVGYKAKIVGGAMDSLRQAIAELESQDDSYCQACDGASCTANKGCVALSNPPQQKPLEVDEDGWFWLNKNECIHVDLIRKIEAAHGIKE